MKLNNYFALFNKNNKKLKMKRLYVLREIALLLWDYCGPKDKLESRMTSIIILL